MRGERGRTAEDDLPDVRDGLTRVERIVLFTLREAQRELGDRNVPLLFLYGRVLERIDVSREEVRAIVGRMSNRFENRG